MKIYYFFLTQRKLKPFSLMKSVILSITTSPMENLKRPPNLFLFHTFFTHVHLYLTVLIILLRVFLSSMGIVLFGFIYYSTRRKQAGEIKADDDAKKLFGVSEEVYRDALAKMHMFGLIPHRFALYEERSSSHPGLLRRTSDGGMSVQPHVNVLRLDGKYSEVRLEYPYLYIKDGNESLTGIPLNKIRWIDIVKKRKKSILYVHVDYLEKPYKLVLSLNENLPDVSEFVDCILSSCPDVRKPSSFEVESFRNAWHGVYLILAFISLVFEQTSLLIGLIALFFLPKDYRRLLFYTLSTVTTCIFLFALKLYGHGLSHVKADTVGYICGAYFIFSFLALRRFFLFTKYYQDYKVKAGRVSYLRLSVIIFVLGLLPLIMVAYILQSSHSDYSKAFLMASYFHWLYEKPYFIGFFLVSLALCGIEIFDKRAKLSPEIVASCVLAIIIIAGYFLIPSLLKNFNYLDPVQSAKQVKIKSDEKPVVRKLFATRNPVGSYDISPDDKYIAFVEYPAKISILDIATRKVKKTIETSERVIHLLFWVEPSKLSYITGKGIIELDMQSGNSKLIYRSQKQELLVHVFFVSGVPLANLRTETKNFTGYSFNLVNTKTGQSLFKNGLSTLPWQEEPALCTSTMDFLHFANDGNILFLFPTSKIYSLNAISNTRQRLIETSSGIMQVLCSRDENNIALVTNNNLFHENKSDLTLWDRKNNISQKTTIPRYAMHLEMSPDGSKFAYMNYLSRTQPYPLEILHFKKDAVHKKTIKFSNIQNGSLPRYMWGKVKNDLYYVLSESDADEKRMYSFFVVEGKYL